jgi:signal transduction histidine kinase
VEYFPSVLAAAMGGFAALGVLFGVAFARRRAAREYGAFALLSCLLAVHASPIVQGSVTPSDAACVVEAFLLAYTALTESRASVASVRTLYGIAAVALAVVIFLSPGLPPLLSALEFVGACALLVAYARTYLAGEREGAFVVVGAGVLGITLVGDVARSVGLLGGPPLALLGYAATVLGMAARLAAQHGAIARELDSRRAEIAKRTRELQQSHHDLRVVQEQLVQKEQLATVGELAAVIAHEVRNPLAIIANAVSSLKKPAVGDAERAQLLEILQDETARLNRIVADLLRYARPLTVQRSHITVGDLLERALQLVRTQDGVKVDLRVDAPDVRIWADANLLRQVFDNLIDNAVQAMGSEGKLSVRVHATTDGDGALAVDIADTGEGMDTAVRTRAKDPFFTTRPAGTGLGLAIVDRIMQAHGGQFDIHSRAGEGTRVTLVLPWGSPTESPLKPSESSEKPANEKRWTQTREP